MGKVRPFPEVRGENVRLYAYHPLNWDGEAGIKNKVLLTQWIAYGVRKQYTGSFAPDMYADHGVRLKALSEYRTQSYYIGGKLHEKTEGSGLDNENRFVGSTAARIRS